MKDYFDKNIHKLEYLNNLILTVVAISWIFVTPAGIIKLPGILLTILGIVGLKTVYKKHKKAGK